MSCRAECLSDSDFLLTLLNKDGFKLLQRWFKIPALASKVDSRERSPDHHCSFDLKTQSIVCGLLGGR
ncbi:hypothetical protein ACPOL_5904 [Acidisarcina polymorpha]|uniref:Uncharacterized protein n=1 Tax=Acidisarcina polymorpha TaxID=2211140 RepID=A0A2Z5G837_9BACT|nr:hypothetical protein ACPOL_5904 [Acidisarcina polymorpha]